MDLYLGVDIGGTTSTIAFGDPQRRLLWISAQFGTRSDHGPAATIADIVQQIVAYLERRAESTDRVAAVTLVTPGPASLDGVLCGSPNLKHPQWNRCPIRQMLQQALSAAGQEVPVDYLGDGQAAALGEFWVRTKALSCDPAPQTEQEGSLADFPADHLHSLFMVTVGTGFGGGEVRNGIVCQGLGGRAGHAGHLFLPPSAFRYPHDQQLKVGNAYCTVESAVSLSALTHQLAYRLTLPQWQTHPLANSDLSIRDRAKSLRELAAADDPLALELFDDQARALGIALLQLQYIGDYDLLVVGGGICDISAAMRRRYKELALAAFVEHALDGFKPTADFAFSICGDQASVIGALAHTYRSDRV